MCEHGELISRAGRLRTLAQPIHHTHACNQNVLKSLRIRSRHLPLPTQPPFKPPLNLIRICLTQHTLRNKLLLTILLMTRWFIVDDRFRLREFKGLFWTTTLVLSANWTKRPSVSEPPNIIHTGKGKLTHKMWPMRPELYQPVLTETLEERATHRGT